MYPSPLTKTKWRSRSRDMLNVDVVGKEGGRLEARHNGDWGNEGRCWASEGLRDGPGTEIRNAKRKRVEVGGLAGSFYMGGRGSRIGILLGRQRRESLLLLRGNRLTSPDDELHCWSCASGRGAIRGPYGRERSTGLVFCCGSGHWPGGPRTPRQLLTSVMGGSALVMLALQPCCRPKFV